jgi:H+/Na+-translocating ferredoxin:NAD+ oxidoreductase subunit B
MKDVYKKLATHLDTLATGYPATKTGIELKILKHLFKPEEAEIVMKLTMIPEPVAVIAERLGQSVEKLAPVLEAISKKGVIYRSGRGDNVAYMASQFVIGFWEFNVNNLFKELIEDVNEYLPEFMMKSWVPNKTKQLRVIPISSEITVDMEIMPYEKAEEIIRSASKIVVSDCICRKEHEIMGHGCGKIMEACLTFGSGAYYYEGNGIGRAIDQEEALAILNKGRDAGLVLQPGNSKKAANICMCCGCCCQVLSNMKTLDKPALVVHTNYYAQVYEDECIGCETCVDRCHMDAISVEDIAEVNTDRCIGCGVCVPTCPTEAIKFLKKDAPLNYEPPETLFETYYNMAKERGNI